MNSAEINFLDINSFCLHIKVDDLFPIRPQ